MHTHICIYPYIYKYIQSFVYVCVWSYIKIGTCIQIDILGWINICMSVNRLVLKRDNSVVYAFVKFGSLCVHYVLMETM